MDEVNCVGDEEHILDCPHTTIEDCSHFEDVAVICDTACTYNGQARLVGGTDETNGRLEVCMNSNWGTVCDDSFDNNDAAVVCRQLNLPTGSMLLHGYAIMLILTILHSSLFRSSISY